LARRRAARTIAPVPALDRVLGALLCVAAPLVASHARAPGSGERCERDLEFALEELERRSGHFFEQKRVDWRAVARELRPEARRAESDQEHLALFVRLLARLRDGHAEVRRLPAGEDVPWPFPEERTGPGMFWCRSDGKILVKSAWATADALGLEPGMEVVRVDGVAAAKWLERRIAEVADTVSFSTDQHALYHACHWGLAAPAGTRLDLELREPGARRLKKRTLTYARANPAAWGPAFFPEGMQRVSDDVAWARTEQGFGYVRLRRSPGDLPGQVDRALAALADPPGLILDFRANGGGGFDHEALMGRFVPAGHVFGSYPSAGPRPYGGPIVAIVDAGTRSAGETGSGIFEEDGRAYLIGESATAGMASQKETIELPSGLFALYVSVASNKGRFNGGKGIEGIGVVPHEIVEYDAEDLAAGRDTLVRRAEELLLDFPAREVRYDPGDHGWAR
jgi:C-terminal processing protease CtpA/Prc